MVFVADDPTFRSTYGTTVFLGASTAVISPASRPSRSCDVTARSPIRSPTVVPAGPWRPDASLELLNPSSDNATPPTGRCPLRPEGHRVTEPIGGGGGDQAAPNTTMTAPAANAVLLHASVTITGTASDNVDVDRVNLTLQNTTTGAWLQRTARSAHRRQWSPRPWSTTRYDHRLAGSATLPNGSYALTATAVDASAIADPSPATRSFSVSVEHRAGHRRPERHPHRAIRRPGLHVRRVSPCPVGHG